MTSEVTGNLSSDGSAKSREIAERDMVIKESSTGKGRGIKDIEGTILEKTKLMAARDASKGGR
jgi:hypothetical protein